MRDRGKPRQRPQTTNDIVNSGSEERVLEMERERETVSREREREREREGECPRARKPRRNR